MAFYRGGGLRPGVEKESCGVVLGGTSFTVIMVLGQKTKNRKSPSVQQDYLIHVHEVKPWPPSQSLRTLRSVLIQWEHGGRNSGSTNPVVPLLGSGVGDGKIEFNESFRLPVTLLRQMSTKSGDGDTFQKNCLELNLYEPRRDKTVRGQLLGTAIIDLAEYGVVKEIVSVSVPIHSKRIFNNAAQPFLFIKIQSVEKGRTSFSSRDNLSKDACMERNGSESASVLANEEHAEESEIASVTDDDVSSHSSLAVSSSAFETNGGLSPNSEENRSQTVKDSPGEVYNQHHLTSKQGLEKLDMKSVDEPWEILKVSSSCSLSTDLSSNRGSLENGQATLSNFPETSLTSMAKKIGARSVESSSSSITYEGAKEDVNTNIRSKDCDSLIQEVDEKKVANDGSEISGNAWHSVEDEPWNRFSQDDTMKQVSAGSDVLSYNGDNLGVNGNILNSDRLKYVKSVRSLVESGRSNGSVRSSTLGDAQNGPLRFVSNERNDTKLYPKETKNITSNGRIEQLEHRIKMLEGELREAAAIEISLYSVVAEHGSSTNKVHAPARRLSRLYLHACEESSQSRRASVARSAASGLVLVAKACGNDVPRAQLPHSARPCIQRTGSRKGNQKQFSLLKWTEFSLSKEKKGALFASYDDWEDPPTFASALEKIEAWIFSRIIESVWWQTLTPHMQTAAAKAISSGMASKASKTYRRTSSSGDQERVNFSLELWKKAFKDACERLCPVRAGGHECGCLPVLARLIMEQCVARLDVAMLNAILRESDDEIPTDPVSDPISDAKVLPIPAGKASFGAGAQLKNVIGTWSRWLTDLFGLDDDDSLDDKNDCDNDDDGTRKDHDTSFKSFHLLNALSDLMMLPKDMLLSQSTRKEVCPIFGPPLIKRVVNNFIPDEFCPDPIPKVVLEALDSEDPLEAEVGLITNFPCSAAPIVYLPPPVSSVAAIIGDIGSQSRLTRSRSSVLKKSYTSDDELDELDSPLTAIVETFQASPTPTKPSWISKEKGSQNAVRYQLLREVWMNSE
ncbi:unnamed protein product [Camellia sinensis]